MRKKGLNGGKQVNETHPPMAPLSCLLPGLESVAPTGGCRWRVNHCRRNGYRQKVLSSGSFRGLLHSEGFRVDVRLSRRGLKEGLSPERGMTELAMDSTTGEVMERMLHEEDATVKFVGLSLENKMNILPLLGRCSRSLLPLIIIRYLFVNLEDVSKNSNGRLSGLFTYLQCSLCLIFFVDSRHS